MKTKTNHEDETFVAGEDAGFDDIMAAAARKRLAYRWEEALALYENGLALTDLSPEALYALHDGRAFCYRRLGQPHQEIESLHEMGRLADAHDNRAWRLEALNREVLALDSLRRLQQSRMLAIQALREAQEAQDAYYEARAHYGMGQGLMNSGQFEEGAEAVMRANEIFKEQGALPEEALCCLMLAYSASASHQKGEEGRRYAQRLLQIARQLDDRLLLGRAYHILGIVHDDEPLLALSFREKTLEIYQEVREIGLLSVAIHNVGIFYLDHGLHKRAYTVLNKALTLQRRPHSAGLSPLTLHVTGIAAFGAGKVEEALALNAQAIEIAAPDSVEKVYATGSRGVLLLRLGRPAEARALLEEGLQMAHTPPAHRPVQLAWLTEACLDMDDREAALRYVREALPYVDDVADPTYFFNVLWAGYRAYDAQGAAENDAQATATAQALLTRAYNAVMAYAERLTDAGLRRAFLSDSNLSQVPEIVLTWARQQSGEAPTSAAQTAAVNGATDGARGAQTGADSGEELSEEESLSSLEGRAVDPYKRLLAFGARLTAQRDATQMPSFILDEFVELSGAERAFLALPRDLALPQEAAANTALAGSEGDVADDMPVIVAVSGMSMEEAQQCYREGAPLVEKVLLARHAVLARRPCEPIEGYRSLIAAPLVTPTLRVGVLYGDVRELFGPFTREDADVLTLLANQSAAALENASWTQTLEKRVARRTVELEEVNRRLAHQNEELALINRVQQAMSQKLEFQALIDLVGHKMSKLFPSFSVSILLYDPVSNLISPHFNMLRGEECETAPFTPHGFSQAVLQSGRPIVVNRDMQAAMTAYGSTMLVDTEPARALAYLPILSKDDVVGVIAILADEEDAFDDDMMRMLKSLATSLSISLENARLFAETQRRAKELYALTEVGRDISATLDLPLVLERIATHARDLLNVSDSAVFLPDDEDDEVMRAVVALGPIARHVKAAHVCCGEGIVGDLWQRRVADYINDASDDPRAMIIAGTENQPDERLMAAPLMAGDIVKGMMVVWRAGGKPFDDHDLDFLKSLARQASIAIENARLYAEAQTARAEAEAANESKSAFLANVSHELRTPLTSILGFTHIVQRRLQERIFPYVDGDDDVARRTMRQIDQNMKIVLGEGERLTALINNVLDLEKIEAGRMTWQMEPLDIAEVLQRAIETTTPLVEQAGLTMNTEIEPGVPPVNGDHDRLLQVMINLISNAMKFTPQGAITCRLWSTPGEAVVSIEDTGVGIAAEELDTVFETFRQVGDTLTGKPAGTGLGLSICKEIVEHHGGRIWAESNLGQGSVFRFAVPLLQPDLDGERVRRVAADDLLAQLREELAHIPARSHDGRPTVLVADDDANIRELLHQELAAHGYRVYEAADGREALAQVRATRPDLIILDVKMPELTGFDVAAVLRSSPDTMSLPIVILSVLRDKERGYRLGVDRYLTKPVKTAELLQEVQTLLSQGPSRRRVLVIDRDADVVQTLSQALLAQGYEVAAYTDGKEALDAILQRCPDIIIADAALSREMNIVQTIRFEKGMQNVLFLLVQS